MDVTVITASLGERPRELYTAMQSVREQTLQPKAHLVAIDPRPVANVRTMLVQMADSEWVAFLDDDDVLLPQHLQVLWDAREGHDVVIPHCKFNGPPLPDGYCNRPFSRAVLNQHGIFPITTLVRKRALLNAGGFFAKDKWEDWSLWNRMADLGARFRVVSEVTWVYSTASYDRRTDMLNACP